jgi:hypothetical protein
MPLNADQRRRLVTALLGAFPNENALTDMIYFADFTPPKTLPSITTASGLTSMVRELITKADAEGWLPKLVDEAAKSNPADLALGQFRDELKPLIIAANANHYRVLLMGDRPLIDREPLRQAMERLATGQKRILVVDGDPVTGKSHTIWFIRYLRDQHKNFNLVWIDLKELFRAAPDGVISPSMIASSMAGQMGMRDLVQLREEETWAAWTNVFCDNLTGRLANAANPWWLVVDNFAAVRLPQDSLGLVKKLCERLSINIPNLNVVLLSYKESVPETVEPDVERETIVSVDAGHVGLFFKELYESRQRPASDQVIAQKVAEVLRAVDPKHPRRLEAIGAEVTRVAKSILQELGP